MSKNTVLTASLHQMASWFRNMTHPKAKRFIYEYDPVQQLTSMENCPIRELGSIWDLSNLSVFLRYTDSLPAIHSHLDHFTQENSLQLETTETRARVYLKEEALGEPSNISHSAFLILSLIAEERATRELNETPPRLRPDANALIELLANGILSQQRKDGSFIIHFEHHYPDHGFELYSGEAMLAMVEAYKKLKDGVYLESTRRAFEYYSTIYYHGHHHGARQSGSTPVTAHRAPGIAKEYLVFFANWMSQALSAFYLCTDAHSQEQQHQQPAHQSQGTQQGQQEEPTQLRARTESIGGGRQQDTQGTHQATAPTTSTTETTQTTPTTPATPLKDYAEVRNEMRHFVFDLHDRIVGKGYYTKIRQYPRYASTVEVACALEGIADALSILLAYEEEKAQKSEKGEGGAEEEDGEGERERGGARGDEEEDQEEEEMEDRKNKYIGAIGIGVDFLLRVQRKEGHGLGGFGYSLLHPIQRIDVTGHVANAFMKVLRLGESYPAVLRLPLDPPVL